MYWTLTHVFTLRFQYIQSAMRQKVNVVWESLFLSSICSCTSLVSLWTEIGIVSQLWDKEVTIEASKMSRNNRKAGKLTKTSNNCRTKFFHLNQNDVCEAKRNHSGPKAPLSVKHGSCCGLGMYGFQWNWHAGIYWWFHSGAEARCIKSHWTAFHPSPGQQS